MITAEPQNDKTALDGMSQDGVIVCKRMVSLEHIQEMTTEINKIHEYVLLNIKNQERPLQTYTDIAERQLGRFDYRCGFSAEIFKIVSQPIIRLIHTLSPLINFRHYWGAIPAMGGSGPTNIHRDVYPITNNMKDEDLSSYDISLPPYYFTVLIPLIQITQENGPTNFIKGSHNKPTVDINKEKVYSPFLAPGDIIIFDGRTLHQGSANQTEDIRWVAYLTFVANWYHDQTFTINHYLFPELQDR